jgi:hypothetical protein
VILDQIDAIINQIPAKDNFLGVWVKRGNGYHYYEHVENLIPYLKEAHRLMQEKKINTVVFAVDSNLKAYARDHFLNADKKIKVLFFDELFDCSTPASGDINPD